jgi:hypothetical protein
MKWSNLILIIEGAIGFDFSHPIGNWKRTPAPLFFSWSNETEVQMATKFNLSRPCLRNFKEKKTP